MQELLQLAEKIDVQIFRFVNRDMSCSLLDLVMPFLTDLNKSPVAIAIGIALVLAWLLRWGRRAATIVAVVLFATAFADLLNSFTVKTEFRRERPFQTLPDVALRSSASGFSFPSNHATNCFTVATVVACAFPQMGLAAFLLAILVAFSRIYVGVHFPFDVLASAVLGTVIGRLVWWLAKGTVEKQSWGWRDPQLSSTSESPK